MSNKTKTDSAVTESDKETAEEFLGLCEQFENSWDGETYTLGNKGGIYVRENLKGDSGFAIMLREFCVSWYGDCKIIAERVWNETD